jgi:hypothetical protein
MMGREFNGRCCGALVVFATCLLSSTSWCSGLEPEILGVTVGFDGHYRAGSWAPVRIEVRGGEQEFRGKLFITTLDGDALPVQHVWGEGEAVSIPAKESRTIQFSVKFGRQAPRLPILLEGTSGGKPIAVRSETVLPQAMRSDRPCILNLGPALATNESVTRRARTADATPVVLAPDIAQLPDSWLGYDAIDTVILTTSDVQLLARFSDQQIRALQQWITLGGRFVLCVGAHGAEVLGKDGRWADFAPGPFEQVVALRNTSPLESYTGASQRLSTLASSEGIPFTLLGKVDGKVELFDVMPGRQRPMIVRAPLGFGLVIFVGFDLDRAPFDRWDGRARLVQLILHHDAADRGETGQDKASATQRVEYGYQDISGQLRSALDQFPDVTLVAFSWVAGLLLLYIALIGPLDYFLLRDIVRRMEWTWLTFPLYVAAFIALAVLLNSRFRTDSTKINHLELVDVDQTSGTVRGTSWTHVYAPRFAQHDFELRPTDMWLGGSADSGRLIAWHGLPGSALGGLDVDATVVAPSADKWQIRFAPGNVSSMAGVPFPVASTRSILGRWWSNVQLSQSAGLSRDADGLLRGELVNPLPTELQDCMVFYENWVYRLNRSVLAPGQRTRIELERALNLQWRLTGRRVVNTKEVGTTWDLNSLDASKILEIMMFHGAAGGESFTHLTNRYQSYVDLSQHLRLGRAILLGRSRSQVTQPRLDGGEVPAKDQQTSTHFRVVFPVDSRRD